MLLLREAIDRQTLLLDLEATSMPAILEAAVALVAERGWLARSHQAEVEEMLLARERVGSTAIGHAVAVPHAYVDLIQEPVIVFVRLARPINLGAPDGIPTHFVFVLLGPEAAVAQHIDTLMNIARVMADDEFRYDVGEARSPADLVAALDSFAARTAPKEKPAAPTDIGALTYTGRLFGGVMQDIRRRLPHYWSDFRDGLHPKTISSTLFLFFACLAPAITFGGIMAQETDNYIGAVEMLLGTAFCGIVYALFSGQPLIILGGTGPLLVFTIILYQLSSYLGVPFLESYAWVGLWTAAILMVLAATDASCLMRFFTRFTDEIFAALISMIFIVKAIESLVHIFTDHEVDYATALLSLLLALGTFYLAMSLSRFRHSRYLLPQMREFLADFGPIIALGLMTGITIWIGEDVHVQSLEAPDTLRPTKEGRAGWFVSPIETPAWVWLAALGPALLAAVLVFMDQNITARIINRPDHKLTKGPAYHLDLGVMAILIAVCSLFGLPWLVAATVRSLNHVRSLATVEESVRPGGEVRENIIHVRENRLSGLLIHSLVGVSLLMLPLMRHVPMAVLYGLFLFMGVVSMAGNQFFERLSLWLMDTSLYPSTHYTRRVPRWTIHKFTFIQFLCLVALWVVEVSVIGILFPLIIALLVPIRYVLNFFFDPEHLAVLDAESVGDVESDRFAD